MAGKHRQGSNLPEYVVWLVIAVVICITVYVLLT